MSRELTPCQLIERSIHKKYRKQLWTPFIAAVKRYALVNAGDRIAVWISNPKSATSESSSSSSSGHHHHHHHSGANANYQRKFDESVGAEIAARRMVLWATRMAIVAVLAGGCVFLWHQNAQLKRDIANLKGTNAVLFSEAAKAQEEKKDLLLEVQTLESDKAELSDVNRTLREALEKMVGQTEGDGQ